MSRVHFIAVGGSAMHNLAIALSKQGHHVTGSDDEIYEPSLSRLRQAGILPNEFGWYPAHITSDIDTIVLGMHARPDNPELAKAQQLGLNILSYPAFLYQQSIDKQRVVIAGSHGKTTTTSMIIHVLRQVGVNADYMVGAQLEGFDTMVQLSEAPIIVLEGDEYLSSPIDSRSKFTHYNPHISVITGIAWDHVNVFPQKHSYVERFKAYIDSHTEGSKIFYYKDDIELGQLCNDTNSKATLIPYIPLQINHTREVTIREETVPFTLVGRHNLANAAAAMYVCKELGVDEVDFLKALESFTGAKKRLQRIYDNEESVGFLDFAHAPSKVRATTQGVKDWYPDKTLIGVLELHTFSSLNKEFLPEYNGTMDHVDEAIVFFDPHTIAMKKMSPLKTEEVANYFNHPNLKVFDDKKAFHDYLYKLDRVGKALLLMSSGTFGGVDFNKLNLW